MSSITLVTTDRIKYISFVVYAWICTLFFMGLIANGHLEAFIKLLMLEETGARYHEIDI